MGGHTMYKVRFFRKGEKPHYVRYNTEAEARRIVALIPGTKYVGPVTVAASGRYDWKEVKRT